MIRQILDNDYLKLIDKYVIMMQQIEKTSLYVSVADLHNKVALPGFIAFGDFDADENLIGFICGYNDDTNVWFQLGLYHEVPFKVKKMINFVEDFLKDNGYTHWTTEYRKNDGKCLAPKLGAKVQVTRYIKEI